MAFLGGLDAPEERELIVAFFDLTEFTKIAATLAPLDVHGLLDPWFEIAGKAVDNAGGRLVKFIGDAGLAVFPPGEPKAVIESLKDLVADTETYMRSKQMPCRLQVRASVGTVAAGPAGPKTDKRIDVFGSAVNEAARLQGGPFLATQALAERLS